MKSYLIHFSTGTVKVQILTCLVKDDDHAHSISDSSFQTSVGCGFESQPVSIEGREVVDMLHDIFSDVHVDSVKIM